MFLFGKNEGQDPRSMTARELALMVRNAANEKELKEMVGVEITDAQYRKVVHMIETLVSDSGSKLSVDTLKSFKEGIFYGLGLGTKMTLLAQDLGIESTVGSMRDKKKLKRLMSKFLFVFEAIDRGIENYTDDVWFENLMKNAKVSEAKKTK